MNTKPELIAYQCIYSWNAFQLPPLACMISIQQLMNNIAHLREEGDHIYIGTYGQMVPRMEDWIYHSMIMTVSVVTVYINKLIRTESLISIIEYLCYCLHVIHLLYIVKEVL